MENNNNSIPPASMTTTMTTEVLNNIIAKIQFLENKAERLEREKTEDKEQAFKDLIKFAVWYSGMDQSKVVKAYNRYVLEVLNKATQD